MRPAADEPVLDAYILCGGRGTRLAPTLPDRPKCLAPIDGRPFLDILLDWLAARGARRFVLCAGYRSRDLQAALPRLRRYGSVRISIEKEPLDTGGALRLALEPGSTGPLLVLNGDSICPLDLGAMSRSHRESGADATLAVTPLPEGADYGAVRVDDGLRITSFGEKVPLATGGRASAGVYLIEALAITSRRAGRAFSLERELFPELALRGTLRAWLDPGPYVDIGTPARYLEAPRRLRDLGLL